MASAEPGRSEPAPDASTATGRIGLRAAVALVALALVAVPFGLLLFLVEDAWPPLHEVDGGARDDLNAYAVTHPGFVDAMRAVSDVGSGPVYLGIFTLLAAWLLRRRVPWLALFVVVTMVGNSALNATVKTLVGRSRPVLPDAVAHAHGQSFPSGHAQGSVAAMSVLLVVFLPTLGVLGRRLAVAFATLAVVAIGFSRIALGVHYVSDVLAGYVLGAAWVAAMLSAFAAWNIPAVAVRTIERPGRRRGPVDGESTGPLRDRQGRITPS